MLTSYIRASLMRMPVGMSFSPVSYFEYPVCDIPIRAASSVWLRSRSSLRSRNRGYIAKYLSIGVRSAVIYKSLVENVYLLRKTAYHILLRMPSYGAPSVPPIFFYPAHPYLVFTFSKIRLYIESLFKAKDPTIFDCSIKSPFFQVENEYFIYFL